MGQPIWVPAPTEKAEKIARAQERAMSMWRERQGNFIGINETATDRHQREWAEGLDEQATGICKCCGKPLNYGA